MTNPIWICHRIREHRAAAGELGRRARAEAEQALAAAGIAWTPDAEWEAYRGEQVGVGEIPGRPRGGGSSWQSATRGLGSIEADHLNGEIALLGRLHGVATPVNDLLQREANALVARGDRPGSVALDTLLSRV